LRDVSLSEAASTDASLDSARSYAATYTAVWDEVLVPLCATPFCHGGRGLFLVLENQQQAYTELLTSRAEGPDCVASATPMIRPNEPAASLLYLKLLDDPPCGERMPFLPGNSGRVDPRDLEQIRRWIALGARND
jgi:hypothetical protein